MAHLLLLCLILANAHLSLSIANGKPQKMVQSSPEVESISFPPAPNPSNGGKQNKGDKPITRKLGKHQPEVANSPTKAPMVGGKTHSSEAKASSQAPMAEVTEENVSVQVENVHLRKHHHSVDKSVAGGGVILGGLATTFLVAIFCYIRATRRHQKDTSTSSIPSSPAASV